MKQRIMTDPLGGRLGDGQPRFRRWIDAARAVRMDGGVGWRGYWRGFVPCFLRYVFLVCLSSRLTKSVLQGVPG